VGVVIVGAFEALLDACRVNAPGQPRLVDARMDGQRQGGEQPDRT
jgi:hypothetical protein